MTKLTAALDTVLPSKADVRQRSDFISFQTSIISFVLPPCRCCGCDISFGRKATASVMAYRVYTAELRQFGAPAIIIVTSWRTPDEVLHAEWFVIQGTQFASEPISCDKRSYPNLPFESEDDMMAEALRRAREHLQGKRDMLPEPVRSNQEKKRHPLFLVQAWLRGRATAFKGVASNTGCPKLGAALNRIVRLPIIISPDDD